ncbi:MAG TPA: hypothetical protein VN969_42900 [Streptosporangiaceae bacterium]|nr:hypothetical protein [Streptosporangiaceae bacterium]
MTRARPPAPPIAPPTPRRTPPRYVGGRQPRSGRPGRADRRTRRRATVAVIAGHAQITMPAALTAETAREPADQGSAGAEVRRQGRRAPATRPGGLRDLVAEHLREFPGAAFTPAPGRQGADPIPPARPGQDR